MVNAEKTRQIGLVLPSSYVGEYQSEPNTIDSETPGLILPASVGGAPQFTPRIEVVGRRLELPSGPDTDLPEPEEPILSPAPFRNKETQKLYVWKAEMERRIGSTACNICELIDKQEDTQRSSKFGKAILKLLNIGFIIVPNEFPYDMYDGQEVLQHDLLVPLKHYSEADNVHLQTRIAFGLALPKAMKEGGYSTSSERAPSNAASSIPGHKHTHLYRLGRKMKRFVYDPESDKREIEWMDK